MTATYRATADTFVLVLRAAAMRELAARSPEFADFLQPPDRHFLALSRRALQVAYASQTLAEHSLETPLGELLGKAPVTCPPQTPLREALAQMHGGASAPSWSRGGPGQGILTRYDVLGRVALAEVPLDTPIARSWCSRCTRSRSRTRRRMRRC